MTLKSENEKESRSQKGRARVLMSRLIFAFVAIYGGILALSTFIGGLGSQSEALKPLTAWSSKTIDQIACSVFPKIFTKQCAIESDYDQKFWEFLGVKFDTKKKNSNDI